MNMRRILRFALPAILFLVAGIFAADAAPVTPPPCLNCSNQPSETNPTNIIASTPAVYVPDMTHANDPLPDGVFAWDSLRQTTNAAYNQEQVHFVLGFKNISGGNVFVLNVKPSCGCTTAELPPTPWTIPPGAHEQIPVTVNVGGKPGVLFKSINVSTDKGSKDLFLQINMLPPVVPTLTDAERAQGVAASKIDRQAVFHGDCASCHVQNGVGKYGLPLFQADCAICHEASPRATMVPDLHQLKVPTNEEFWRTWIAHGKPGSFMPAFSQSDGGPLSDMQIASLAAYLNTVIPSHVTPLPQ
jgi:mono/diheme cytochrome c family protein